MTPSPLRPLLILTLGLFAGGCVARTAYHVVTLPVRAGSQVVDWSTTSRDEADRNYGRKMRKQEKKQQEEARREEKRQRKAAEEAQRHPPYN